LSVTKKRIKPLRKLAKNQSAHADLP